MRKFLLLPLAAALLVAGLSGCRKENGIDNNTVIQRPYSLLFSDIEGAMYNTNTGDTFKIMFPPDGAADRAIVTSGNNIVWVKNNVFLSQDNGKAFNPTYLFSQTSLKANWQPMIINVPDHGRIYLTALSAKGDIVYSEDNGRTWIPDTMFVPGARPAAGFMSSFTQLNNGVLFAHDFTNSQFFVRLNKGARWAAFSPGSLPASRYFLSHIDNTLLAVDNAGAQGVWYSKDSARNWTQYAGIPTGQELLSAAAPFDQTVLIGTDSMGVYRLENGVFVASSVGLDAYTSVRGIVGKNNIFKNGRDDRYVYITTSTGLYISGDLGRNWIKVKSGNYNRVY